MEMNDMLQEMLKDYDISDPDMRDHSVREVLQEIIIYGLSKAGFFRKAAFVGGTALRVFHGLDRFSEDLDFMLMNPCDFDIKDYFPILEKSLSIFGVRFEVTEKIRKWSKIAAGEVKASTKELYMTFFQKEGYSEEMYRTQLTKIKLEIDTDPAGQASFEWKVRTRPFIHEVAVCDMPSLFAGKMHALLFRGWGNIVKGRDLYDYLFYASQKIPFNINFLNEKMKKTGFTERDLTFEEITGMLKKRFIEIDYGSAIRDTLPYVGVDKKEEVKKWSSELFIQTVGDLRCEGTFTFQGEYVDNGSLAHARMKRNRKGIPPRYAR